MAAGFREDFVEADGFCIRYMEAGEGPALARAGTSAIGATSPFDSAPANGGSPHPFRTFRAGYEIETPVTG